MLIFVRHGHSDLTMQQLRSTVRVRSDEFFVESRAVVAQLPRAQVAGAPAVTETMT